MLVATGSGQVRGAVADGVRVALGIPYAEPPFGPGRFKKPQPRAAWSGVRDCTRFGPVAPQSAQLPGAPAWSPGREDILSLNVWAPEASQHVGPAAGTDAHGPGLPVLFWIHGGAYTFGSSAQPDYDGTALARTGLVVVTCNYRVGFEGFGHVPGFPDNRGLLDQIAALRWVRDNIRAFGGDPEHVTVAGQSAGAGSAVCLMASGRAEGLFGRAIAHSVPDAYRSAEFAEDLTVRVAEAAGVAPTRDGLLSAGPQALVEASDRITERYAKDPESGPLHYDTVLYGPVVDGDVLPQEPCAALAAGAGRSVELLVCHTTQEAWLMHEVGSLPPVTTRPALERFAADFGLPAQLVDAYGRLMPDAPVLDVYLALSGDAVFAAHSVAVARAHTRAGGRTHLSRFDRRRTRADGTTVRPWHAADVPFVFGTLDAEGIDFLTGGPVDEDDRALSARMIRSWSAFATTGSPGWSPLTAAAEPAHVWAVPHDRTEHVAAPHTLWDGLRPAPLHL